MYKSSATLEDVYRLALPEGTQLLVGQAYLDRPVSWACSLRPSPPAFPKLEGNELALIDVAELHRLDAKMQLARVVDNLQTARVAAVAVLGEVAPAAVRAADRARLALFQLPDDESLVQIERTVIRLIVDRASYIAQRAAALQRQLNQIALDGDGLGEIARRVHHFASQPVLFLHNDNRSDGRVAAEAGIEHLSERQRQLLLAGLPNMMTLRSWAATQSGEGLASAVTTMPLTLLGEPASGEGQFSGIVVSPVVANEGVHGYAILLRLRESEVNGGGQRLANSYQPSLNGGLNGGPSGGAGVAELEISAVEEMAVTQAAAAAALEWAKQNAVGVAEERMRAAFVDELLAAEIADEQAWIQRGKSLGYDLAQPHVAWMVEARGVTNWPQPLLRFLDERTTAPYCRRDGGILLFWPIDNPKSGRELKTQAQAFVERLQKENVGADIVIGIGRPGVGPGNWRQSQQQARESWRLGREWQTSPVTYFGDLGLYQLLTALGDNHEAARFFRKTLGRLIEHDQQHNAELVETLDAFFVCHGNLSQTASRLHIHRNTLTYRLDRIASITALDLSDADARFSLQLALKLRPVMRSVG